MSCQQFVSCSLRRMCESAVYSPTCSLPLILCDRSNSAQLMVSFERSQIEIAEHIDQRLEESRHATAGHIGKVLELSTHAIVQHMDRRFNSLERRHTEPASSRDNFDDGVLSTKRWIPQTTQRNNQLIAARFLECTPGCQCQCHQAHAYQWSIASLWPIKGAINVIYQASSTRPCTSYLCQSSQRQQRPVRQLRVLIKLPSWIVRSSVALFYSNMSGNPELVIRVINHRPASDVHPQSLFGRILENDVEGVKRRLVDGSASIHDVFGTSTIRPDAREQAETC